MLGERTEKVENSTRYNPENGSLLTEPRLFNLMFKTYVGPVESEENVAYLRPETAQAIFAQFKNVLEVSRQKVPFGICQIGKAFRNEINPRNFTFRSREFEQMELEFFIQPGRGGAKADRLRRQPAGPAALPRPATQLGLAGVAQILGRGAHPLVREHRPGPRHAGSILAEARGTGPLRQGDGGYPFKFPFGTQELEGIAARGDFDLSSTRSSAASRWKYFDEEAKAKYVPHVIEPSAGVDRLVLALICNAYGEDEVTDEKGKTESRVVMRFHPRIAPVKVGVFPLLKNKPELVEKARLCAICCVRT